MSNMGRRLDQILDKYESRRKHRIEIDRRDRIVVDQQGNAVVVYRPETEIEKYERLVHESHKLWLMWANGYRDAWDDLTWMVVGEYAFVVADHRVGLRKSMTCSVARYLDKLTRYTVRYQIDEIVKALKEIEDITKGDE